MNTINSSLYWSLPRPREFVEKITQASRTARLLVLSLPEFMPLQPLHTLHAVELALKRANIPDPAVLHIQDGMNISATVGTHFGMPLMPAESLAHHVHSTQHAVVLSASGQRAQEHCEKYAGEFIGALQDAVGNIRLVLTVHNGEHEHDSAAPNIRVIAFDGALNGAEMDAYVAQRMVSRPGPGSTSLYRHLVTEYAAFDPGLAETLALMEPHQILDLPGSLTGLLSDNPLRWSHDSWVAGTRCSCSKETHPLREWYLATHPGAQSQRFIALSERRYWKACLKALIPWLEERRQGIIEMLDRPLTQIDRGGSKKIEKRSGTSTISVTRGELEYNDLVFQSYQPKFNQINHTLDETKAITICQLAKTVRDDLSHLRRPDMEEVAALISNMDELFPG